MELSAAGLPSGFVFVIVIIVLLILISIQYTLNLILRELREIRRKMRQDGYGGREREKEHE